MKGYGIEKDWSLTAWGENHATFTVTHSDSTLTSEKMPEHTDNIDGVTPPTPNPPGPTPDPNPVPGPVPNENCDDIDTAGALDPYGNGCEYYTEDQMYCDDTFSINNESGFNPMMMCCACGGGNNNDDDSNPTPPGPTPDENGDCEENTTDLDPYGYGCDYYTENP